MTVLKRGSAFALRRGIMPAFWAFLLLLTPFSIQASRNLLFWEAQAVAGYFGSNQAWELYSHHPHDAMQKPSLGIDYLGRFGNAGKDFGYLAMQARLAYDKNEANKLQPQLYNAFINWKAPIADIWLGHNKTALGLSSYLDNHSLLLADNTMSGLNFDRDWGAGIKAETMLLDLSASVTTGSGMPLWVGKNHLLVLRAGLGDPNKDNHSLGVSVAQGKILKSMGYTVMHNNKLHELRLGGLDAAWRYLDLDIKGDLLYGSYDSDPAYAALFRTGLFLLPEERAILDLQAHLTKLKDAENQYYTVGLSYRLTPYLSLRTAITRHDPGGHDSVALQVYCYKGIVF